MNQEKEFSFAHLVADIRAAVGDKDGRLMQQDELVERCRLLYALEQTGDIYCFFCSSNIEWEDHEPDCPYIAAKRLIKDV